MKGEKKKNVACAQVNLGERDGIVQIKVRMKEKEEKKKGNTTRLVGRRKLKLQAQR